MTVAAGGGRPRRAPPRGSSLPERPYVLLSAATSVDGCLDDATDTRLILSNDADLDRVDEVRAGCDAIMVGAGTIRRDNPALLVRSQARRNRRAARGLAASPARVTITGTGDIDPAARFFTTGAGARLVYVPGAAAGRARERLLGTPGEVIGIGGSAPLDLAAVLADLAHRGMRRVMVEGGGTVLAQFLAAGLADEFHLVIAPVVVGDSRAPRIAGGSGGSSPRGGAAGGSAGSSPGGSIAGEPAAARRRMHLAEVRTIGDVVLLRYLSGRPEPEGRAR